MSRAVALAALGLATVLTAGCARYGAAEGVSTGRAFGYTVTRSASFPQGYVVTDDKGRRYLCRGQVGPAARKALEIALSQEFVLRRRVDVVTTASNELYRCRRG